MIPSELLFTIIKDDVYKTEEIQEVSRNSQELPKTFLFDFKSQGLSKVFLEEYSKHFWDTFQGDRCADIQIGGMETGAIPLIAGLSLLAPSSKKVNAFYIRKSRKKSDLANLIEGNIRTGVPIVLVDDILNRGVTIRKQIAILEERGHRVSAVFVCLRFRDLSAYQDLIDKGIQVVSIFELNDFSHVLPVKNLVDNQANREQVIRYRIKYKVTLTDKPNLYIVIPKSGPVIAGDHIYMGVDDGNFFCVDGRNGEVLWHHKVLFGAGGKRIFSTPVVYKDVVMFGAYDGNLYCLDRFTGERKWVFMDADWIGSSPCIDERKGVVFVGLEFGLFKKRGGVVAIDIASGKALWKNYTMEGLTHASPSYNRKTNTVVCGCNDTYMYAFNARTGDILWKYKTEGEVKYGAIFDDKRGAVIFGSMDGGVYVLSMRDGTLMHTFKARFGFYSTPVLYKDTVIIGSLDKRVYCFSLSSKETRWVFETAGRIFASPLLDGESVFIGSNDGRLYELNTETGTLVSSIQFTERIVNRIAIEHTKEGKRILYVPTHTGELYTVVEKQNP